VLVGVDIKPWGASRAMEADAARFATRSAMFVPQCDRSDLRGVRHLLYVSGLRVTDVPQRLFSDREVRLIVCCTMPGEMYAFSRGALRVLLQIIAYDRNCKGTTDCEVPQAYTLVKVSKRDGYPFYTPTGCTCAHCLV
jgi:hypothetical protein